jgi:glutamate synthase domain-containing protein 3
MVTVERFSGGAQGGIGILLNIFDFERPVGFYCCSGMTAGKALIRGPVQDAQLGIGVEKAEELDDSDRQLLTQEIEDFVRVFDGRLDEGYQEGLNAFAGRFRKEPDSVFSEFTKIVPLPPPSPGREEHV